MAADIDNFRAGPSGEAALHAGFDVIVVGGGHAGTEAALAAARTGANTLLVTHRIDTLGQMSCNPAIGGIGKSHLVREIDALDGAMARAADAAGIQFRVLNASKGPAVRATRAQADRSLYRSAIRSILENQDKLTIFQSSVDDLVLEGDRVAGVVTAMGITFRASQVVLTAGTFLAGRIHVGLDNHTGGRAGAAASVSLAERLRELPLRVGRLKTGTPPRIDGRSVDFTVMEEQPGDDPRPVMSFLGSVDDHPRQVPCWITRTTEATHEIIRGGLDRSPMYSGAIEGVGPRYCPSIEDKVVRFADRASHQIFVEPEGLDTHELYPNGISTSLPFDVQVALVRSIPGSNTPTSTRPGYAIEYDFFDPRDLKPSLESRFVPGLFLAGQINGTTGYEEAGAQGLLAGLNAARASRGEAAWCPRRDEAYIGVLVDDLITMGTLEPYRMFTSRAEYRLLLREDNADLRLTETGRELGLVGDERWEVFTERRDLLGSGRSVLTATRATPGNHIAQALEPKLGRKLSKDATLFDLLRRPEIVAQDLADYLPASVMANAGVLEQLDIEAKYDGYIARQRAEVEKTRELEATELPPDLDYDAVPGLSTEIRLRLNEARPLSVAQAGRVPGVTPAAVSLLLVWLKKHRMLDQRLAAAMSAVSGLPVVPAVNPVPAVDA